MVTREKIKKTGGVSVISAAEKMGDGNENNGAERGGSERVEKSAAKNSELSENPASDEGANYSKNNVRDAAEAAAARNFSSEPSSYQTEEKPGNKSVRFEPDSKTLLREHKRREHEPSQMEDRL